MSFITKKYKVQHSRIVFSPLSNGFTEHEWFLLISFSLILEKLDFVGKEFKILLQDSNNMFLKFLETVTQRLDPG